MITKNRVPLKYIFSIVKKDLIWVILISIATKIIYVSLDNYIPKMPITIPIFLGTAISILLSFKVGQSYDRWWEARKIWGSIVNDSRKLIILLQSYLSEDSTIIKSITYKQIAFNYVLGNSLRDVNPYTYTDGVLSEKEKNILNKHSNKSLKILSLISAELKSLKQAHKIDSFQHINLNNVISNQVDSMGKAERISNTVFPTTYRQFFHITIFIFLILFSMALNDIEIHYEVPLLIIIAMIFFFLEKTAYIIQDPFMNRPSDTPVTAIARTIEINLKELIEDDTIPEALQPTKYYIM